MSREDACMVAGIATVLFGAFFGTWHKNDAIAAQLAEAGLHLLEFAIHRRFSG
jgi:predicted Kef-type K+ transport protein